MLALKLLPILSEVLLTSTWLAGKDTLWVAELYIYYELLIP